MIRETFRAVKARVLIRSISKPPIVIVASRRGGSTMLADVIACNPGIWLADEPFAVLPNHPGYELKQRMLPYREHSQYFDLHGADLDRFEDYVDGLMRARLSELGTSRRTRLPFNADRVCLKVLNAPWMLEWFLAQLGGDVIFMTRHPAAQALSVLRQNWDFGVKAYFNRPRALLEYFSEAQIRVGRKILDHGSDWEVAILDWIVNTRPGFASASPDLISVRYENLVADPRSFIADVLVGRLRLPELERMAETFGIPSNSSYMSDGDTRNAIAAGNKDKLLCAWMKQIDGSDRNKAQYLLDHFDVSAYSMSSPEPLA